jgi:hypothetical protein
VQNSSGNFLLGFRAAADIFIGWVGADNNCKVKKKGKVPLLACHEDVALPFV